MGYAFNLGAQKVILYRYSISESPNQRFSGLVYARGMLSITDDGFQSGYRWLEVCGNGPTVAHNLCKKATMSSGLAASLASSSERGM